MIMDNSFRKPINWGIITEAIRHYEICGYEYIEVPWSTTEEPSMATCPTQDHLTPIGTRCNAGNNSSGHYEYVIGSAEQAFIGLDLAGKLDRSKKYVACTPCWRKEPVYDETHFGTFMKVELYVPVTDAPPDIMSVVMEARGFFLGYVNRPREIKIVATPEGFDIEYLGVELGSYGYRRYKDVRWVYGTGVAEPRFSSVRRD